MAEPTALSLCSLPSDIYDFLSDFLDDDSLFVLLTLSRNITVANYLLQKRKWRRKSILYLARKGDLKGVKYLCRLQIPITPMNAMIAITWACEMGDLAMAKYLHTTVGAECTGCEMNMASENGHLAVVQFLHSIGTKCTSYAMDMASANGHLEVVQFLHSIKAPYTTSAMDQASGHGFLDVVQFLHSIGAPHTERAINWAQKNGRYDVVGFFTAFS